MGGTSTTSQTQAATTAPWTAAQPAINGILGQLNPMISNTGNTAGENDSFNSIINNAGNTSQFNPQIDASTSSLLSGGGATNQAGAVNNAFQQYQAQTNPLASNTNYDPTQTPGMAALLQQIQGDVGNSVNGQFAAAGRNLSGMNQQTLARVISQGEAAPLLAQYNQNIQNQQGAAGNLYNAANTNAGLLAGMQQQSVANQQAGVNQVQTGLNAQNAGATTALNAQVQQQQLPAQYLGLLSQIGIPIAGLGSQSTGTSNGTADMSGAQQFGTIATGTGNLLKGLFG